MRKAGLILFFTTASLICLGQQHGIYSQYIFNLYMVNPAYVGARDALSANLSYRTQWIGFEGAPTTQNFSIHGPLKNRNMGLGLQVQNDEIGARKTPSASLAYAYKIKLDRDRKISFGLQAGMINYQINWNQLEYEIPNDPVAYSTDGNRWIPTFDFGLMYLAPKSYVGISAAGLNRSPLTASDFSDARLNTFLNFVAGYVFELSESMMLKPSVLARHSLQGPTQFDVNLGALVKNTVWLTATYRYDFGLVFSGHLILREKFHVGYAYDYALNNLVAVQSGTHELFIGYDFNVYRAKPTSPRYF